MSDGPAAAPVTAAPHARPSAPGRVWAEALAVAAAVLPLLLAMDAYVRDSPVPRNDELIYELMAREPLDPHTFPFAHRIAVPMLVHLLPFGTTFSFSALAWLSTAACGGLIYVLLRRFDIDRWLSAALGVGLALSPTLFVVSLREGRNVDPESLLVMLAGSIAIVDRRRVAFGAIVLVGCLVREAALFLVPFAYAVWAGRLWDREAARDVVLSALPAGIAYAAVRLAVPAVAREQVLGYESLLGGRVEVLRKAAEQPWTILRRMAIAFGPLWLAAPFALDDLRFARRGMVLLAVCAASMTFALDWGRIVFLAAPVVVVAAAWALRSRPRLAVTAVVALFAMDLAYAVYMEELGGVDNLIDPPPTRYPAV